MNKGLNPKLKKIVSQINIGDGVVLELNDNYPGGDRAIGYVKTLTSTRLSIVMKRDTGIFDSIMNNFGIFRPTFTDMKNIKIVDPVDIK
ncbi:hypothetical protein ACFL4H_01925 [Candidatus Neomarinimicrobiota bacterium]